MTDNEEFVSRSDVIEVIKNSLVHTIFAASLQGGIMTDIQIAAIKKIKDALEAMENGEGNGSNGCAFADKEEWEMPCEKCKRNQRDYWRAKEGDK